nr:L,D-transpeptidase [Rhizobium sp. L1K21]
MKRTGLRLATLCLSVAIVGSASAASAAMSAQQPVSARSDVVQVAVQKTVKPEFKRRMVRFETNEAPGTIIVDTQNKFLYHVNGKNRAMRYGIGVGREGFGWSGTVKVSRKAEWPGWTPPPEMIARERRKGHILPAYMEGGEDNPLGARALYLYRSSGDSGYRIHGTNQPWSIGQNMSSGCIRMMNKDVEHLYERVPVGTKVIVIGPDGKSGKVRFNDKGIDLLGTLFGG